MYRYTLSIPMLDIYISILKYTNITWAIGDPRSTMTSGQSRSAHMRSTIVDDKTSCVLFKREHATCGFAWNLFLRIGVRID